MSTGSDQPSPTAPGRSILSPLRAVAAVCLIAPFVAMLWIPSYNKTSPKLLGFPFFYWYQLLWVIITAVLMIVAFTAVNRDRAQRRRASSASAASAREGRDGTEAGR
ncbi:DUF3311 domain-containing protein [Actinocrinis sp.]|uniref:DUF3311 domain-containing protein n=1 Tax=Actinocrinis sp. TaxID=1920516 RepID=UPI002D2F134C|nr:DUF3311 domain-containing protein [Actinocrinis sp.]HZP54292.1 DUF3311 domain-containing protein [Actinocrinis sp.]